MGNHTPGFNHESISVCLVGGLDEDGTTVVENYTEHQRDTLAYLIAMILNSWPDIRVVERRDIQKRKGDPERSISKELIEAAVTKAASFTNAKPITEITKGAKRGKPPEAD